LCPRAEKYCAPSIPRKEKGLAVRRLERKAIAIERANQAAVHCDRNSE
jgi:hypothetical protein